MVLLQSDLANVFLFKLIGVIYACHPLPGLTLLVALMSVENFLPGNLALVLFLCWLCAYLLHV